MSWHADSNNAALMEDGRRIIMVSGLHCWLFIRIFDCETQLFEQVVMLRTPIKLSFPYLILEGDKIWIYSGAGDILSITLESLDILFWRDCSTLIQEDYSFEDIWLFPRGYPLKPRHPVK